MGDPTAYLPPALSAEHISTFIESIGLPVPVNVKPLKAAAQFHSIYLVEFASDASSFIRSQYSLSNKGSNDSVVLVLRVAGRHLPGIKTLNEVGIMTWVKQNTSIPVPAIVKFNASEKNSLGHEYSLLEKAEGVSVDTVYDELSHTAKASLVDQLIDVLVQLHNRPFQDFVGGLIVGPDNTVDKGPIVDEYFWQVPDIEKYWNGSETVESLNPVSPTGYTGYTSFIAASVRHYAYAIEKHASLASFRDLLPRLDAFVATINSDEHAATLNDVKYVLAHKDLHFGNIMCDPADDACPITSILDWEFSGVVPAPRWNPPRAFLWNTQANDEAKVEQAKLEKMFEEKCRARGMEFLLEDVKMNKKQERMQTLTNYLRAIVEVCPRGQAKAQVEGWKATVMQCLEAFGV